MEKIVEALQLLDTKDDAHWTANGLPKMDVINDLVKSDPPLTRQQLTEFAPEFTREKPALPGGAPPEPPEPPAPIPPGVDDVEDQVTGAPPVQEKTEGVLTEAELEEAFEAANEVVAKANAVLEEARVAQLAAQKALDNVIRERERQGDMPHIKQQKDIRTYLDGVQRRNKDRAARRQALIGRVDPRDLQVGAPIDRAMARNTARGNRRPTRPVST